MSLIHSMVNTSLKKGKRVYDPQKPTDYLAVRAKEVEQNQKVKVPKSVRIEETVLAGIQVEKLTSTENPADKIIFYLHGGGFVGGSVKTRRSFTGYLAGKLGYNVLAVEYRLAPEAPFPAAPMDCFAVYQELIREYAPQNVVILGGECRGQSGAGHIASDQAGGAASAGSRDVYCALCAVRSGIS